MINLYRKLGAASIVNKAIKAWNNFGVYGHSRLISFIVQIMLNLILKCLQLSFKLFDFLPFISNNPKKLSPELRSVNLILNIIKSLIPIRLTWPIFNNCLFRFDTIYLNIFNRICNYGLGSLCTIPIYTNILNKTLFKTHFIISCANKLSSKYNITFDVNTSNNSLHQTDHAKFEPRDVEYLWIENVGNDEIAMDDNDKIICYVHGGGYTLGGPSHIGYASRLSKCANSKILFIHYAKPPIADIPYQVDQILTMYFYLLLHLNIDHNNIIFCGDSAGGGLITLFIQKLALLNLSKIHPLGIILFSPWVDLTMSADSWLECQYHDLIVDKSYVSRSGLIAVGNNQKNLTSPFFSAIYAPKYKCNCNVMVYVSKHECLFDDSQKLVETLRLNNNFKEIGDNGKGYDDEDDVAGDNPANGTVEENELIFHVISWMPHAFPIFYTIFPEVDIVMSQVCHVIDRWLKMDKSSFELN